MLNLEVISLRLQKEYQKDWSVKMMADACHVSESYFAHCFKERFHISPNRYLRDIRISKAKELLENTKFTITEISMLVGIDDPLYFSRSFKDLVGVSPKGYRKLIQSKANIETKNE